jgi:uncharacterized protein (TIGR00288 family)
MGLGFNNRRDKFEINKVLERLVEKGKIVAKKAYADWSRFGMYTGGLHEAAIELVEIPRRGMSGKNSADIRLVVDAIDLAYSKDHIDTFVIVSGDSDFSPLVSKLKELGKHVIGLGLVDATSDLLRDNCDEFIYYEDLDRAPIIPVAVNEQIPEKKRKVFALLLDSLLALRRENKDVIYSSMVKDTMKRKKPSFNEEYYGFRTFSELLEDAQQDGLVEIEKHKSSGMYIVSRFGLEMNTGVMPPNGGPHKSTRVNPPEERKDRPVPAAREPGREPATPMVRPAILPDRQRTVRPTPSPVHVAPTPPPEPVRPRPPAEPLPSRLAPLREEVEPSPDSRDTRPLGRELVDEIDLDDFDEVPSYSPRKPVSPSKSAEPQAKPAAPKASGPNRATPAARAPVTPKSAAPKSLAADKPALPEKPAPAEKPAATDKRPRTPTGGRKKPTPPAVAAVQEPAPTPAPAPAAPPQPTPVKPPVTRVAAPLDDDDFGAGLDG